MLKKLFIDKTRWLSALAMLCIVVPTFIVTQFAGTPGRIIGVIVYASIGYVGLYEIYKCLGVNRYISLIISLVIIPFIILEWKVFEDFIDGTRNNDLLSKMIFSALKDWKIYLIVFASTLIPIILDDSFRRSNYFLVKQLILIFVTFLTVIFAKIIWTINVKSIYHFIFFVSIAIVSDTFAYIGGMLFGKKLFNGAKFAPKLSPKKTWAGFVIGFVCAALFSILIGYFGKIWSDFGSKQLFVAIFAGLFLALVAPYGDLAFSAIKRLVGIKDFSNLIPGHGGIYDRIDAMSLVVVIGGFTYLFV